MEPTSSARKLGYFWAFIMGCAFGIALGGAGVMLFHDAAPDELREGQRP